MPKYQCSFCGKYDPPTKKCSACGKAWYCGTKCQKWDWVRHIFDCNPSRPITTADHLALAVKRNLLPEDRQTCIDYGFTGLVSHRPFLLGLYTGLLDPQRLGVKPTTLHKWRVNGTLVENIKKEFERVPKQSRGGYYVWFLENEHLLGTRDPKEDEEHLRSEIAGWVKRAWRFTGGSSTATDEEIQQCIHSMPDGKQDCHLLYTWLLSGMHPSPDQRLWVDFGFCACSCPEEEMELAGRYISLIHKCAFDEFYAAFSSSSLLSLFEKHEIDIQSRFVRDVLSLGHKSVWDLKQYIKLNDTMTTPISAVSVDYGFFNCQNEQERELLFDLYKGFFAPASTANSLELHKACIAGRLFEHFTQDLLFKIKEKKTYKRLLKNPYPLPDI